jgi:hypothetical protein
MGGFALKLSSCGSFRLLRFYLYTYRHLRNIYFLMT